MNKQGKKNTKDEGEGMFGVDDVVEADDVVVLEFLHQGYFPDCRRRSALLGFQVDFFERDNVAGYAVLALEHGGICSVF